MYVSKDEFYAMRIIPQKTVIRELECSIHIKDHINVKHLLYHTRYLKSTQYVVAILCIITLITPETPKYLGTNKCSCLSEKITLTGWKESLVSAFIFFVNFFTYVLNNRKLSGCSLVCSTTLCNILFFTSHSNFRDP